MSTPNPEGRPRPPRPPRRSRSLLALTCAAAATLAIVATLLALRYDDLVAWWTTHQILERAESAVTAVRDELAGTPPSNLADYDFFAEAIEAVTNEHRDELVRDLLDRDLVLSRIPPSGPDDDDLAIPFVTFCASIVARSEAKIFDTSDTDQLADEFRPWMTALLRSRPAKAALARALTREWTWFGITGEGAQASFWKWHLARVLFTGEFARHRAKLFADIPPSAWNTAERHARESSSPDVRAGALLLLSYHPDPDAFTRVAIAALDDPALEPRLAAAGALALHELGEGADALIHGGLTHERWEVRWWCAALLPWAKYESSLEILEAHLPRETDPWVQSCIQAILAKLMDHERPRELTLFDG